VLKSNVQAPILVSGDVHMFELLRKDCRRVAKNSETLETDSFNRMLLEVTASGLTHSWGSTPCARPKESALCRSRYFKQVLRLAVHFAHNNGAWTELVKVKRSETQEGAKSGIQYAILRHFSEFEFKWEKRQVTIRILTEDPTRPPLSSTTWNLDMLSGRIASPATGLVSNDDYRIQYESLQSLGIAKDNDWICLNYRGHSTPLRKLYGFASSMLLILTLLFLPVVLPGIMACFMMRSRRKTIKRKVA